MDPEPDVIREHIEQTRSGLSRKLETLETEVIGTVRGTTAAVTETVETVKDRVESTVENVKHTVEETFETIKDTFDLRLQTERHPWAMFGASVFTGAVLGNMLPSVRSMAPHGSDLAQRAPPVAPTPPSARRSFFAGLIEQLGPEIEQIRGLAIGVTAALVRDLVKRQVPEAVVPHVQEMIHSATERLGGTEIEGPILGKEQSLARRG